MEDTDKGYESKVMQAMLGKFSWDFHSLPHVGYTFNPGAVCYNVVDSSDKSRYSA